MSSVFVSHSLVRRLAEDSRSSLGMSLVALLIVAAVFGPMLVPYGPDATDFMATLAPPSSGHWLGTDDLGRDVLSRILAGARVSLLVGFVSVGGAVLVGLPIGLAAGYFGRKTDAVLMRCMDVLLAFPGILLALGITAALGASLSNTIIAIAVINTPTIARVARAQTMLISSLDYVKANRALGFGHVTIMLRSILPNAMSPVLVQASLLLASSIITESYLSFLGLGVQPPTPTWGTMLRDAVSFIDQADWLAWFPGAAIFLTVLGFNLFGDGLRDRLDPRD
ncbi:ABC transporter permease [Rhizobium johnstonii]|uniref:ABC transporter permease n=1 Tax=Rhizobium TaxID=379 RepID=UPI0010325E63|nr:ABC transporter permease [Rhizobium leguminosarum]TBF70840.1 ABC transporter permease [Rhizobium leguminosarum]TBG93291.1 ABC transporter permease [Rhizobium leguminosarum]TBG98693.1 ABC transporter permease [Rhizobium leguminosarum]TBH29906.1 ABC transporter permease [Rhizobium leguminosarum]TBH50136.1 ABC transporter permease [Rhizobium leguminosarum]